MKKEITRIRKGRPIGSEIRDMMAEILKDNPDISGYTIHKKFRDKFRRKHTCLRNIYYHLQKGVVLGIFEISSVAQSEQNDADMKLYRLKSEVISNDKI